VTNKKKKLAPDEREPLRDDVLACRPNKSQGSSQSLDTQARQSLTAAFYESADAAFQAQAELNWLGALARQKTSRVLQ